MPFFVCFLFPVSMYFTICKSLETTLYYSVSQRRTYNFWWPCASFFLSLRISFCVPCRSTSTQQKEPIIIRWAWLSGSPGVLNHPLLPKESSTRFATNDPILPYLIEDILAKQKTAKCLRFLGLNRQASAAINSPKQCVGSLCATLSLSKNIIFCFLVKLVFQWLLWLLHSKP